MTEQVVNVVSSGDTPLTQNVESNIVDEHVPEGQDKVESVQNEADSSSVVHDEEQGNPDSDNNKNIDAIIEKKLSKVKRKLEREIRVNEVLNRKSDKLDDNGSLTPESYAEVVAEERVKQKIKELRQLEHHEKLIDEFEERADKLRVVHKDFDEVVRNESLPITDVMADIIYNSSHGPELAYYLGTHVKEALKIANMSELKQAFELGKLLESVKNSDVKKSSKKVDVPEPIKGISGSSSKTLRHDINDPVFAANASTEDWIQAYKAAYGKRLG